MFSKRTENQLKKGENNRVANAIRSDAKRREEKEKEPKARGEPLNPAEFTNFMGTHHDHCQELRAPMNHRATAVLGRGGL